LNAGFVSDVHLSDQDGATVERFLDHLNSARGRVSSLVVLGDLFDVWVGDDLLREEALRPKFMSPLLESLKRLGVPVFWGSGNRDFLIGAGFADYMNQHGILVQLLAEEATTVTTNRQGQAVKILMAHGDQWCTDDKPYQEFRSKVRLAAWQEEFLAKPLTERLTIAAQMRTESEQTKQGNASYIMDVNARAIAQVFERYEADIIVHGHTHRPANHRSVVDGQSRRRFVLSDWKADTNRGAIVPMIQFL
jgi:UDP-2,3-diacylglucosamine hydrolase